MLLNKCVQNVVFYFLNDCLRKEWNVTSLEVRGLCENVFVNDDNDFHDTVRLVAYAPTNANLIFILFKFHIKQCLEKCVVNISNM